MLLIHGNGNERREIDWSQILLNPKYRVTVRLIAYLMQNVVYSNNMQIDTAINESSKPNIIVLKFGLFSFSELEPGLTWFLYKPTQANLSQLLKNEVALIGILSPSKVGIKTHKNTCKSTRLSQYSSSSNVVFHRD